MDRIDFTVMREQINSAFSGFAVIDEDGIIKNVNRSFERNFGLSAAAVIGRPLDIIVPEFKLQKQVTDGVFETEIEGQCYYLIPTELCSGENGHWMGISFINVTVSGELAAKLKDERNLNAELAEILEGSFDGILVTDKDGKILFVNSSYERVAEIKRSDMEGKSMRDLINPVWMPNSVAYVVAEQKTTVSKRQIVKSGRHIMVTGKPIFDRDGEIKKIVINARDITEIYDLSEELQKSKSAEKLYMERLSDFSQMNQKASPILAVSKEMKDALSLAEKVANFQATVLILGESGVGKEEVAKFIHKNSMRRDKPFIAINCGAIPDNLLESELFGYEKGAFTGAINTGKEGLLEAAAGGTVFLDEIGETPLDFQVKLLRFLESKEIRRVGSNHSKSVDVRVLAATNRNLETMIEEGTFRRDLYYRINVVQIEVPPLRKRKEDIVPLASFFLQKYNQKYGQEKLLTMELVDELEKYQWVGNVRELKNVIENMVIVSNNEYLQTEDLPWDVKDKKMQKRRLIDEISEQDLTLGEAVAELEKQILLRTRETCSSTREMAVKLDVNQSTIVRKMQKYNIG
ncbi:MAG: sigma 54-interacting transcriptional regulator [Emergencia timonensis]|uniref:sigma 54-interacting transcriptional regulator n=1 Tax=Emergencia timonensis TaxID=1776384 RepID=UPI0008342A18|nr:sigma 54-interacting transcriptional regulator [Emergencia timonensis]WNX87312.1 sigma 54-interacting transcriptional regulator [Emergencia timonensis]